MFNYDVDHDTKSRVLELLERHMPKVLKMEAADAGPPPKNRTFRYRIKLSARDRQKMLAMLRRGKPQHVIAAALGCTQGTISKQLKTLGVTCTRGRRPAA